MANGKTQSVVTMHLIPHGKFKIIVMDNPSETAIPTYADQLKIYGVTDVVRTCEQTYEPEQFESKGIRVHEMTFADGAPPPDEIIQKWVDLVTLRSKSKDPTEIGVLAVHCVAGLGRAPVMAAVALIEMTGIDPMEAVEKIRERQKGAINARQLKFLQTYVRKNKKGLLEGGAGCTCQVM
mmetsp:Transcript_103289/g.267085  ORF Transcript_103289/g.267085 Transcript_103289/m.267085 type:complete len:180 (-) Transcript_103289:102-641(-)